LNGARKYVLNPHPNHTAGGTRRCCKSKRMFKTFLWFLQSVLPGPKMAVDSQECITLKHHRSWKILSNFMENDNIPASLMNRRFKVLRSGTPSTEMYGRCAQPGRRDKTLQQSCGVSQAKLPFFPNNCAPIFSPNMVL